MYILRISNITKRYQLENNKTRTVLDNVSLMFPEKGLVAVIGKSGSGKSTLMNIISLLDEPTNGCIYFNNENTSSWSKRRRMEYLNSDIGIIFQSYHLLENETALFNVMLPALISGKNEKEAEFAAKNLLKSISFNEKLYLSKCKNLSGGEKERIAILRALINNPRIVLADEPTGALDTKNSEIVMNTLKDISKTRLVIMVTHNLNLVKSCADTTISINDGKIEKVKDIKNIDNENKRLKKEPTKKIKQKRWISYLSRSNFKRRFKRNIISIASLVIGLVSTMLIIGFSFGNESSIKNRNYAQLDYGVATLYKETTQSVPGSKMTLVQMSRPSQEEISDIDLSDFYVEPNTDILLSPYPTIKSGDDILEDLSYAPIYSFIDAGVDKTLLIKGKLPDEDSFEEVVINKTAYKYLQKEYKSEPLGLVLNIHSSYEYHYYTNESTRPVINDYFIFDKTITIVGVVDDFGFLTANKIFYPFIALKELLNDSLLVNLSSYLHASISWYDQLEMCDGGETLSSYSYRLFLKDSHKNSELDGIIKGIEEPYKLEATSVTLGNTLLDLMKAATMGMEIFLLIAIIGTALILGIISFSSYSEDKKTSAILTCLGADKSDIFNIYINENLLLGLISLTISLIVAPLLMVVINRIVFHFTSFSNIITIPFLSFLDVPFLFPLIIFSITVLVCLLATYIPLFFSKKISPKEELSEE